MEVYFPLLGIRLPSGKCLFVWKRMKGEAPGEGTRSEALLEWGYEEPVPL